MVSNGGCYTVSQAHEPTMGEALARLDAAARPHVRERLRRGKDAIAWMRGLERLAAPLEASGNVAGLFRLADALDQGRLEVAA